MVVKRVGQMVLAGVCALVLAGCSSTVAGVALKVTGPANSDDAVVALMNTGDYSTTPNHPLGSAGSAGDLFEAERMAEFVVDPSQVDKDLRDWTVLDEPAVPLFDDTFPGKTEFLKDIALAHGLIAGFQTTRSRVTSITTDLHADSLTNVVLRFPDPEAAAAAAAAAAAELQATSPPPNGPAVRVPIHDQPETVATAAVDRDEVTAHSFTAHGPYVLYQLTEAEASLTDPFFYATGLISAVVSYQKTLIDRFIPTDPAKLAELPKDPTGQLLSHTLTSIDNNIPGSAAGAYPTRGWLHFEEDPVTAATLLNHAGVKWVSQLLATVYEARNRDGATEVVDRFAAQMTDTPFVQPIDGVSGLPRAKCFQRTRDFATATEPQSWQRMVWHFKCIAQADRYAFTTFSDNAKDVKQQISAQYRILAGK